MVLNVTIALMSQVCFSTLYPSAEANSYLPFRSFPFRSPSISSLRPCYNSNTIFHQQLSMHRDLSVLCALPTDHRHNNLRIVVHICLDFLKMNSSSAVKKNTNLHHSNGRLSFHSPSQPCLL